MIQFIVENTETPSFDEQKIKTWILSTAAQHGRKVGRINFIFCNDERILEVNKQYLQHDYYTDIITFDYSSGKQVSGDIFISIDTVKSNSDELKTDYTIEFYRVLIHGVLHLCGQNDKTNEEQDEMTRKENEALENLTAIL